MQRGADQAGTARRRRLRRAVRRHEAPRAAGAGAGVASPTCCCWTSRPTTWTSTRSPGWKASSSSSPAALVFVTHDRSFLRALATRIVEIDRGQVDRLAGRLRQLPAPPRGTPARRGAGERAVRQAAGAGRSLDPPGHQGPPHPQRRPRARAEGAARERARAARARRQRATWPLAQAQQVRQEGHRERRTSFRPTASRVLFDDFSTTILRGDRIGIIGAQRRRQDHAAEAAARRTAAASRRGRAGHAICRSPISTSYRSQLNDEARTCRRTWPRAATSSRSTARASTSSATCRISCSRPSAPARRSRACPAASATACCWPSCSRSRPTCWCWTNRPTTWTSKRWSCWRSCWASIKGTCCWSATTATFLDNVVTSTLVLEGEGRVGEYVGGYSDWLRQRPNALFNAESAAPAKASPSPVQTAAAVAEPKRKLSYKDAARTGAAAGAHRKAGSRHRRAYRIDERA